MLTSKLDLYKPEWLELVFANRNKEYGAYYLRHHYAGNIVKAMGITFSFISLLITIGLMTRGTPIAKIQPAPDMVVTLSDAKLIKLPIPKKASIPISPKQLSPVRTQKFTTPVAAPDPVSIKPPKNDQLTAVISSVDANGKDDGVNALPPVNTDNGTGTQPVEDVSLHAVKGLDVMPEPFGGINAWAKFLNKNLLFPTEARDKQVNGKVVLSFIIEKDGHLSNIVVERSAGYGFDEEAIRVLKLAKPWKPGMQNGQPVRVKYIIPINFQSAEN